MAAVLDQIENFYMSCASFYFPVILQDIFNMFGNLEIKYSAVGLNKARLCSNDKDIPGSCGVEEGKLYLLL